MRRVLAFLGALIVALLLVVPGVRAADPLAHSGRVLIDVQGDVAIPAGDQADVVVVVGGRAEIRGVVNTLVVVDGSADLQGASLETLVAVRGQVEVGPDTVVRGEIRRLDSTVHQSGNAIVAGGIVDLAPRLLEFGGVLATVLLLLWIGFGIANILAGLLLAALGARQVRAAKELIVHEPALAGVSGLLAAILVPVAGILLLPTVVLAPVGVAILVVALPLIAFGGYLVAAVWVGEWLLGMLGDHRERERPYLAVVIGVVVLGLVGMVPVAGLLVAVASLLGFGALLVLGLRTIFGRPRPFTGAMQPLTTPNPA
ncbi:MAG TPA: hypothetical protein VHR16_05375 [Candidatus Limnocylindrales bacterium]|nr:hypothetical protein [Candidatus Limnocylindrales bacterium]